MEAPTAGSDTVTFGQDERGGKCQVWIENNNQTSEDVGYRLTWMHSKGTPADHKA